MFRIKDFFHILYWFYKLKYSKCREMQRKCSILHESKCEFWVARKTNPKTQKLIVCGDLIEETIMFITNGKEKYDWAVLSFLLFIKHCSKVSKSKQKGSKPNFKQMLKENIWLGVKWMDDQTIEALYFIKSLVQWWLVGVRKIIQREESAS